MVWLHLMKEIVMPRLSLVLIMLILSSEAYCAEFSGYLKTYAVMQKEKDLDVIEVPKMDLLQTTLRLKLESKGERAAWEVHYELNTVNSSRRLSSYVLPGSSDERLPVKRTYRYNDLNREISKDDQYSLQQNLDRLNIQFQLDSGDLTLGRQAISLGTSRFVNPMDVFLPFDLRVLNTEYRPGIDAIRFQKPLGSLGELDIGWVFGRDGEWQNSAAYAKISSRLRGQDFQITFVNTESLLLVGAGIQGAIGNSGYWLEVANVSGDDDYTRISIGLDHALTDNIYFMTEYHYNGIGTTSPQKYFEQYERDAYQQHGVFLLGEQYLASSLNVQVSPVTATGLQMLYNLDDRSAFVALSVERHLTDDLYLDLGYYRFFGDKKLVFSEKNGIVPTSEYGLNPDMAYISLRYYF